MNYNKICVFDFETDGSDPKQCSPVQIAAIIVDPINLEIIPNSEFNINFKPEVLENNNDYIYTTDILDSFPITSTYGSNINYQPQIDHWMKMKAGRHNSLVLYFADQNLKPLIMLDNNILVTLMIKLPKKK